MSKLKKEQSDGLDPSSSGSKTGLLIKAMLVLLPVVLGGICFVSVDCEPQTANYADGRMLIQLSGPLEWKINGRSRKLESTNLLKYQDERPTTYLMKYQCACEPNEWSQEEAMKQAWPMIRYAYVEDFWRSAMRDSQEQPVEEIGVLFIGESNGGNEPPQRLITAPIEVIPEGIEQGW